MSDKQLTELNIVIETGKLENQKKLEEALNALKETKLLCDSILRWEGQLSCLVGLRAQKSASLDALRINDGLKGGLTILTSDLEVHLQGDAQELQSLAIKILAKYPLMQKVK